MLEAMFLHRKIEFQYTEISNDMTSILRKDGKYYNLNLYTIYWANNTYYLIGAHDNHDGLTNYRLDRILNLRISDEYALDAKDKIGLNPEAYIQKYIEESVNHFSGEISRIEVEYIPDRITNAILFDFAGKDIAVQVIEKGKCRAIFTKMNSVMLTAWFMQYASRFKVIKPESLKNNIIGELQNSLKMYDL